MAEAVKVVVRCRPMNTREKDLKCENVIEMDNRVGQCSIRNPNDKKAPPKSFTFDGAYFVNSTTEQMYADVGYGLVENVCEGYNGTIFAYGQTGCGKSFSMQGIIDPATQRGIIPRAFDHIFETIQVSEGVKFLVHASYLEIYNEEIRDLLSTDFKKKLDLKEHPEKGVYVQGLTMHPVQNVRECQKVMDKGWSHRSTGATLMNDQSSRSHSIFTINLEMIQTDEAGEDHIRAAKLNLVDLAGSERQAKTGATGDRLKEATKINLSLSALGNVISALVDGKSKHIPYRDSKLTRLLQDSLGGNTKTLMVACLSPADNNYDETLSTLRYANRAKNIKNKPKINEDPKDALLRQYQEEIEQLKAIIMGKLPMPDGGFDLSSLAGIQAVAADKKQHQRVPTAQSEVDQSKLREEKEAIKAEYEEKMQEIREAYEAEQTSKKKLEEDLNKLRDYYDNEIAAVDSKYQHIAPSAYVAASREDSVVSDQSKSTGGEAGDAEKKHKRQGDVSGAAVAVALHTSAVVAAEHAVASGEVRPAGDSSEAVEVTERAEQEKERLHKELEVQKQQLIVAASVDGLTDEALDEKIKELEQNFDERVTAVDQEAEIAKAAVIGTNPDIAFGMNEGEVEPDSVGEEPNEPVMVVGEDGKMVASDADKVVAAVAVGSKHGEGPSAPRSSPTVADAAATPAADSGPQALAAEEALKRLQMLQHQMVGGEQSSNTALKKKRVNRKKWADERKRRLAEAIANMDDDGIMINIYESVSDEVKIKDNTIRKLKDKTETLQKDIIDLQSEFEFDRIDYLDTIRKQEKQLALYTQLLEKVQPLVRRDCNYFRMDTIKRSAKWDEERKEWLLPQVQLEGGGSGAGAGHRRYNHPSGMQPGGRVQGRSPRGNSNSPQEDNTANGYDDEYDEERIKQRIIQSSDKKAMNYFKSNRQQQLLQKTEYIDGVNGQVHAPNIPAPLPRSPHKLARAPPDEPMSAALRAAQVHGTIGIDEPRKPMRLDALRVDDLGGGTSGGRRKKKKHHNMMEQY